MSSQNTEIHQQRVLETLRLCPENMDSVLDVGCGKGKLSNVLRERIALVIGVDLNIEHMAEMKAPCCQADLYRLPFTTDSFDLVLCSEVLEHLDHENERQAINEMARIARQYVMVTVPWRQQLLPAMVRCPQCKAVFHVSGHVREFFSEHDMATPHGFRLHTFRPIVPVARAPQLTALVRLAHRLGAYMAPASPPIYCETCREYVTADSSFPLAGRMAWAVRNRISRIVMRYQPAVVAGWSAWLFERDK